MNIAEILKYCPEGTTLYSTAFGEVSFIRVVPLLNTIRVKLSEVFGNKIEDFYKDGSFYICGECILFPSKEQRDWNKFRIPVKKGDIMMDIDGKCPFIATGEWYNDISPKYICGINSRKLFQIKFCDKGGWTPDFYIPASEEAKKELFYKMKEAGYRWNANTLELEKIEPKFKKGDIITDKKGSIFLISKIFDGGNTLEMAAVLNKEGLTINPNVWKNPYDKSIASEEDRNKLFSAITKEGYRYDKEQHKLIKQEFKQFDKVLVRDAPSQKWSINLFSYYDKEDEAYPYVCLNERYSYCIPYEGNEYLVGTTINPPLMG